MRKTSLIILFFTLTFSIKAQIFKEKYIKDATVVANNWLNNVVTKNYGFAYLDYSHQVKENSDSTYWIQAVDQLMKEFGKFKKREIIKSEFKNNLENLPLACTLVLTCLLMHGIGHKLRRILVSIMFLMTLYPYSLRLLVLHTA